MGILKCNNSLVENKFSLYLSVCSIVLAIILPYFLDSFWLRIVTGIFMWIGLGESWNIICGYMGHVSFGHGAFFGIGAYITAFLITKVNIPFLPAMLIGGLLTFVFAILVGYPTLRLKGSYFAIGTWAFAEMMRQLFLISKVAGGAFGLRLPPVLNERFFYFIMLFLALIVIVSTYFIFEKSLFGLKVKAIRDEETAAKTLGLDTLKIKILVFALSAFFPGLIGGAYAYWITYIHPDSVLGPLIADQMVLMVLMGGLGTIVGPVIGASLLYVGSRLIWVNWSDSSFYLIILGLAMCAVILFLPGGLISLPRLRFRTTARKKFSV